jgi:NO-binding membrane sensor protein with MHYT domain
MDDMHHAAAAAPVLVGSYDYVLVALSVVIAIMAAYAALDLARRVTFARGWARMLWPSARRTVFHVSCGHQRACNPRGAAR